MSTLGWIALTLGATWLSVLVLAACWVIACEVMARRNRDAIEQEDCQVICLKADDLPVLLAP